MNDEPGGSRIYRARGPFASVPEALILDHTVSANGLRMWALLDRYAGSDGAAFPAIDRLAGDLGWSRSTAQRAIANIEDTGWLTKQRRTPGGVCDYFVQDTKQEVKSDQGGSVKSDLGGQVKSDLRVRSDLTYRKRATEGDGSSSPSVVVKSNGNSDDHERRMQGRGSPLRPPSDTTVTTDDGPSHREPDPWEGTPAWSLVNDSLSSDLTLPRAEVGALCQRVANLSAQGHPDHVLIAGLREYWRKGNSLNFLDHTVTAAAKRAAADDDPWHDEQWQRFLARNGGTR